jgi:farnesyl diphosphate synthase
MLLSPLTFCPVPSVHMSTPPLSFEDRLRADQTAVEARLEHWIETASGGPERFIQSLRHAVLGGGKRFRPFLVLETARLCGGDPAAALDTAAALECVHCYSLVHDDLPSMDNDETRRGRPTVWKAYDDWTAILAGDALLTLAFEILTSAHTIAPSVQVQLVRALAQASGATGMVGGQAYDLTSDKRGEPRSPTLEQIRRLQAMKTGALIRFGCLAGPVIAGRPANEVAALTTYGEYLGFAFQISDDLLDATGDAATVGKAVRKDAAAGKATLVSLMGLSAARAKLAEVEAAAILALDPFGAAAETLRAAARFVARRES